MATLKFVIRKSRINSRGETSIYLQYIHGSFPVLISTKRKINPRFWNDARGKVRSSHPDYNGLSGVLANIEIKINKIVNDAMMRDIEPTTTYVKEQFSKKLRKSSSSNSGAPRRAKAKTKFYDAFQEFIDINVPKLASGTIARYKVLKKHIQNFEKQYKYKISFASITYDFFEQFQNYFILDLENANNTYFKNIKSLKTFMTWAMKKKYHSNIDYHDFKLTEDETEIIYLTEEELMKIYRHDFSDQEVLDEIRDLFCLCCFTGLRLSDVINLKKGDVKGSKIAQQRQIKTRKVVAQVPLIDFAQAILEKNYTRYPYSKNYFKSRVSKTVNDYLLQIGKAAKIDSEVTLVLYRGAKRIDNTMPKYEAIKTHTARRTFITLSLQKGMRAETLIKITGHSSLKTLMKYVRIADNVIEDEIGKAWNKDKNKNSD